MRKFFIPAIAAGCLFALPALAAAPTDASSQIAPQDSAQIQQQLHQDLTTAGYTDIRIVPGSFLVRAKDKQGQTTEMMISPHSMTEVTAMDTSQASASAGKSEGGNSESPSPSVQTSK